MPEIRLNPDGSVPDGYVIMPRDPSDPEYDKSRNNARLEQLQYTIETSLDQKTWMGGGPIYTDYQRARRELHNTNWAGLGCCTTYARLVDQRGEVYGEGTWTGEH